MSISTTPKFKVGDRARYKRGGHVHTIKDVGERYYVIRTEAGRTEPYEIVQMDDYYEKERTLVATHVVVNSFNHYVEGGAYRGDKVRATVHLYSDGTHEVEVAPSEASPPIEVGDRVTTQHGLGPGVVRYVGEHRIFVEFGAANSDSSFKPEYLTKESSPISHSAVLVRKDGDEVDWDWSGLKYDDTKAEWPKCGVVIARFNLHKDDSVTVDLPTF